MAEAVGAGAKMTGDDAGPAVVDLVTAGLLGERGGWGWARWLTDEELHRLRLYWWRRHVTLDENLAALAEDHGPEAAARAVLTLHELIGRLRAVLDDEERFRERARARGVPRQGGRGWVPEEVIAEVKRRVRLDQLIEAHTDCRLGPGRNGRRTGRCPFHEDRTPSLVVYLGDPDDQHYHCFGCHQGGDCIALLRAVAPWLSFAEAVEGLASVAGVDWPPAPPRPPGPPAPPRYLDLAADVADG